MYGVHFVALCFERQAYSEHGKYVAVIFTLALGDSPEVGGRGCCSPCSNGGWKAVLSNKVDFDKWWWSLLGSILEPPPLLANPSLLEDLCRIVTAEIASHLALEPGL